MILKIVFLVRIRVDFFALHFRMYIVISVGCRFVLNWGPNHMYFSTDDKNRLYKYILLLAMFWGGKTGCTYIAVV